jgi:hypothetical protein
MAPDGSLFILLYDGVIRSTAPHIGALFDSTTDLVFPHRLGAIGNDRVAVTHRAGLSLFGADGGALVYDFAQIGGMSDCACEDLTTAPSGVFLYAPGCNGSPLLKGNVDGAGISTFATPPALDDGGFANFICSARDPAGGFYTVLRDENMSPRLYRFAESASGPQDFVEVTTSPSLAQAQASTSEVFAFDYCSLAVAHDGTLFLQTMSQLWSVSP